MRSLDERHVRGPIGTIGHIASVLVLPWPRDLALVPELVAIGAAARDRNTRLQLVATPKHGMRTVSRFEAASDWFRGFTRRDREVAADPQAVVEAARDLLDGSAVGSSERPETGDVLLCTHGSRDRCCGSLGTALAVELAATRVPSDGWTFHRTFHLGGHRFAPTAVVLPEGTAWAYLDADSLGRILARRGSVHSVLGLYRGCLALPTPAVQALERELLSANGWSWLDRPRRGWEEPDGSAIVEAICADGTVRAWRGHVAVRRVLPVPECGQPLDAATKTESELEVLRVEQVR